MAQKQTVRYNETIRARTGEALNQCFKVGLSPAMWNRHGQAILDMIMAGHAPERIVRTIRKIDGLKVIPNIEPSKPIQDKPLSITWHKVSYRLFNALLSHAQESETEQVDYGDIITTTHRATDDPLCLRHIHYTNPEQPDEWLVGHPTGVDVQTT